MTTITDGSKADLLAAVADLPPRLAAIRTAEAEAWAAHDARFEEFRASIMTGLADLREAVAIPAWRRVLDALRTRGGGLA